MQGVIATDQPKGHDTWPTGARWRCTRPRDEHRSSRSSATKCDHSAFFPQQRANGPRPGPAYPNRSFTCLLSSSGDPDGAILQPSIPNTLALSAPRSSNLLMLDRLLYDQPSRRRPISLIDHTKKKKRPRAESSFFLTHALDKHGHKGPDPWQTIE